MPLPNENNEIEERIKELEEKIEKMENHRHLGDDGSRELSGETRISAKEITFEGAGTQVKDFTVLPLRIVDGRDLENKPKRMSAMGMAVLDEKESANEVVNVILTTGKKISIDDVVPSNKLDFDKVNLGNLLLTIFPQSSAFLSAGTLLPPSAQISGYRTPIVINQTGYIVQGGSTLNDLNADFTEDQLVGSILQLSSSLESHHIIGNTKDTITIGRWNPAVGLVAESWLTETGDHAYQVITPVQLGQANWPFSRLFVGSDIRLGYGASGGAQVQYIKWGIGSPEGAVFANRGSIFLRKDGGVNTTLYIKTSGDGTSSGWTAK